MTCYVTDILEVQYRYEDNQTAPRSEHTGTYSGRLGDEEESYNEGSSSHASVSRHYLNTPYPNSGAHYDGDNLGHDDSITSIGTDLERVTISEPPTNSEEKQVGEFQDVSEMDFSSQCTTLYKRYCLTSSSDDKMYRLYYFSFFEDTCIS